MNHVGKKCGEYEKRIVKQWIWSVR